MLSHILGFGLCTSWLWSLFLEGPLLEQLAPAWHQTVETLFLLFMLFNSLGSFSFGYLLKHTLLKTTALFRASYIMTSLLTCLFLSLPVYDLCPKAISTEVALGLAALTGLVAAPLFMGWCAAIGLLTISRAAIVFACSICLTTFLVLLIPLLPFTSQLLLLVMLPILSLYLFNHTPHPPQTQPENIDLTFKELFPRQLFLIIILVYIAGGSMFKLVFLNADFPQLFYLSNISYAIICLAGASLLLKSQAPDTFLLYRPVLPLTGLGFLLLPLVPPLVSFLLLQGGLAAFDMYTWLLIATLSRAHLRPYTVTGYGLGWITLCIFCGDFLHTLFLATATTLPRTDYVAAAAGAICLLATQLYPNFPKKQEEHSVPSELPIPSQPSISIQPPVQSQELPKLEPTPPLETPPIETAVVTTTLPEPIPTTPTVVPIPKKALKAVYEIDKLKVLLTPRERQVMFLLTQGRNYKTISEKLGITPNTVKFHIGHIYDKFGVYSRQELLELLENQLTEENNPRS